MIPKQAPQASRKQPYVVLDGDHLKLRHRLHDTQDCTTCGEAALTGRQQRRYRRGVCSGDLAGPWPDSVQGDAYMRVVLHRATKHDTFVACLTRDPQ